MQHGKITVHSISDPSGTTAPSAGINGELGRLALLSELNNISVNSTPASANNFLVEVEDYYAQILSTGHIKFFKIVPITVSLNGGGTYETGQIVNSVNLTWSYNSGNLDPNVSQSLNNGIGGLPVSQRAYTYTTPISANTTFTISATDTTRGSASSNSSVNFGKRIYYGVTSNATVTSLDISAANFSSLRTSTDPDLDVTYDCTGGRYFFFAYPKAWGLLNLINTKVNGLSFSDFSDNTGGAQASPFELTITNIYGYSEIYYIYKSFNLQNGSAIPVQFRN